jgi:hypothetical protein
LIYLCNAIRKQLKTSSFKQVPYKIIIGIATSQRYQTKYPNASFSRQADKSSQENKKKLKKCINFVKSNLKIDSCNNETILNKKKNRNEMLYSK